MANIGNRFVRWILWLALGVLVLLAAGLLFLQTTYAKDYLTNVILDFLIDRTGYQISLDDIQIDWFDEVTASNFQIEDRSDSVMFRTSVSTFNYSLYDLVSSSTLQLDHLSIQDGEFNLYKYSDSTSINLLDFIFKLGQRDTASKARSVHLSTLEFENLRMNYKDLRIDAPHDSIFHPDYFSFNISQLSASQFKFSKDTLSVIFEKMIGQELYSGLPVNHFQSDFYLFPTALVLENVLIETQRSSFGDSIAFLFSKPSNLAYFKDSVKMDIRLSQSSLDVRDLQFFGNVPDVSEELVLDGTLSGYLAALDLEGFSVGLQSGEKIVFDASLLGLPRLNETFIDMAVEEAFVQEYLLDHILPGAQERIKQIHFKGALVGFLKDFVVYGNALTPYGSIEADINFKLSESLVESAYNGSFAFQKYRIGELLGINGLQEMDFKGSIRGAGFSAETADFLMNATVNNLRYLDYTYDSLGLYGQFRSSFFDGDIGFDDERGKLQGSTTIDFSLPEEVISVQLNIDSVDLKAFSITPKETWFSSGLSANLNEFDIDLMTGAIAFTNVDIRTPQTFLTLDSIKINSDKNDVKRRYKLKSDIIDVLVTGDFKILELVEDLPAILRSFSSEFMFEGSDSIVISSVIDYQSKFEFQVKSLNPVLRLLNLPVFISDGSQIGFQFKHQSDVSFNLLATIDTIQLYDRVFYQNELQVDASKGISSEQVLGLLQFSSSAQSWNDQISTESLSFEAIWDGNEINSFTKIAQPENKNRVNIRSLTTLKKDTIDFKVLPSDILFFNTAWNVNRSNHIQLFRDKLIIDQLELHKGNRLVSLDGVISDSSITSLYFRFEEYDLFTLSSLSPIPFGGILNATGRLSRLNGEQPLRVETEVEVDQLTFDETFIGDLNGISSWDNAVNGLFVDYSVTRENIETIDLGGYIKPFQEDQLDIQVSFDKAELDLLEPLFETLISDLDGTATGELNLTGLLSRPKLRGISIIDGGVVTIDYLNTTYGFSGATRFFEEQIAFDNLVITDRFQNFGSLNGAINHNQFQDVDLNVAINFDEFELLNTNSQLNSLYYGNAFATGTVNLQGPLQNILISAEATSTPNTRVYIPLIEENKAQQGAFIKFKSKVDSSDVAEEEVKLSGINIDFDMDITPDAYIELIFNPRTGDIIRGRGEGNLQLSVNSSGDFDLFGGYTVTEGAYNFTTSLINKEFQLVPGGIINWFGDPYEGQMDMTATYRQLADIEDWNPNDSSSTRSIVKVNLDMQGSMLTPEIGFKLELEDQNSSDPRWSQVISTINSDEEELKRQVFSLLILRKFSQREEFIVGGSNTVSTGISSSVSEFVSNQLSYWLNQVDENLEIDFDINSLDADAFNTFQLRLAYSFLDGRLRVTRGGGITTIVEEGTSSDLQGILGDWSVEYVLTEDGKWNARFFSRNNQYNSTARQLQETGLSLQYVTSFDEFREILKSGRKSGRLGK